MAKRPSMGARMARANSGVGGGGVARASAAAAPPRKSLGGGWAEKRTVDGASYYHNRTTGEVSYDCPPELATGDEIADAGDWIWVPDEKVGFMPAQRLGAAAGGGLNVKLQNGMATTVAAGATTYPLQTSSLKRLESDLVMLDLSLIHI